MKLDKELVTGESTTTGLNILASGTSVRGCSGQFRGPSRLSRGQQQQRAHETNCSIRYLTHLITTKLLARQERQMAGLGVPKVKAIFV